jgi:hypothetical protein
MAFVEKHQRVLRQVIHHRRGRLARRGARQMARVVLDAFAVADLVHHFQIEARALFEPLRLHQLARLDELIEALTQLGLDRLHGGQHAIARRHVVARRVDDEARHLLPDAAGQRVEQRQALDHVVEELDADRELAVLGRKDVDHVAAHAKTAAREVRLVARVLHADQLLDHVALADLVAGTHDEAHLRVVLRLADAVDRAHRRDDDRVAALEHAFRGRQPHLLDVLVDRAVLLDEQVALRHIGLGLVVVVVADEVLDGILREELAELAVELRGECLVRRKNDRRAAAARDDVCHREGFARAGDAKQRLERKAVVDAFDEFVDGLRLVAGRRVRHEELERRVGEGHELAGRLGLGHRFRSFQHWW